MTTTTIESIKVSNAPIVKDDVQVLGDGSCKLTIETEVEAATKMTAEAEKEVTKQKNKTNDEKDIFEVVEASSLRMWDKFMKYKPKTDKQKKLKILLTDAIKTGLNDFYRPRLDPSFDKNGEICYKFGEMPAIGKSFNWWNRKAEKYCPERGSRLGTKTEYVAFLGVLIKRLVADGWTVQDAWSAVCDDSKELGYYLNSKNAELDFEATGSREICGFFDLANTYKILADDEEDGGFWLASGGYCNNSGDYPLADFEHHYNRDNDNNYCVGWLVLEK